MSLRPYQVQAIDEIREAYNKGARKVLLHLATGAGKTVIFCYILKKLHDQAVRAGMVVKGRKLVDQASKRLIREKVDHGVLMANHWNYRPYERIKVCSIDTIISRKISLDDVEMIIIDEAHMATTEGYKNFINAHPECLYLSVTASPFGSSLLHLSDAVVHPISLLGLIDEGYLVAPRYVCPHVPDLKDVKVQGGEYNQVDLAEAIDKGDLIGNIVDHWLDWAENRPTLCFGVNVAHSEHIAARFRKAGVPALHIDADTPDNQRDEAYEKLRTGELKVVTNVGISAVGVDIPCVEVIIKARPTKSYNLYIQQAGRGTRPIYAGGFDIETKEGRLAAIAASTKPTFLIIDHAGNFLRHGKITEEREPNLAKDKKEEKEYEEYLERVVVPYKNCPTCSTPYRGDICPNTALYGCKPPPPDLREEIGGKLVEVTGMADDEIYLLRLKATAHKKNYSWLWCAHRLEERFGLEVALKHYPGFERARNHNKRAALSNQASEFLRAYAEKK